MEWFNWGQQRSIFGIPIAWFLVIESFSCISSICHFWQITVIRPPYTISIDALGTIASTTFDNVRMFLLGRLLVAVLWGCATLTKLVFTHHFLFLAYAGLVLSVVYSTQCACLLCYALYRKLRGSFLEESFRFRRTHYLPIQWPSYFWVFFPLSVISLWVICMVCYDAHLSYINIIKAGGTGWEGKAAYQIHQSDPSGVSRLRDTWGARMRLVDPEQPDKD